MQVFDRGFVKFNDPSDKVANPCVFGDYTEGVINAMEQMAGKRMGFEIE